MSAANIGAVMDEIGTALAGITGLRVFDFPPKSAQPPFVFVDMPEQIAFDSAMKRGYDRMVINVVVCVADNVDRAVRDQIAAYAAGSGTGSVKATLEAAGIGESCRVMSCEFRPVLLAGTTYFGAVFALDVLF